MSEYKILPINLTFIIITTYLSHYERNTHSVDNIYENALDALQMTQTYVMNVLYTAA